MRNEGLRKAIHLSASAVPLWYVCYTTRTEITELLLGISVLLLIGEVLRSYVPYFKKVYLKTLGPLLREKERHKPLNGATYLYLGMLISVVFFEKKVAVSAMWIVILADTAASLTGQRWGKTRLGTKSLEGSLAFMVTSAVIIYLTGWPFFLALGAGTLLTIVELMPGRMNDNVLIPVTAGVVLTLAKQVFI